MGTSFRVVVLVGAAAASIASTKHKPQTVTAISAPKGASDADIFDASVRVLTDEGYSLADKDREAGIVRTEWMNRSQDGTVRRAYAYRVTVGEGAFKVFVDCKMETRNQLSLSEEWNEADCGDRRPENLLNKVPKLQRAIGDEATRRAAKRGTGDPAGSAPAPATPAPAP